MLELRKGNVQTLGQDEQSSLIYGMPRAAFERGAVLRQYPLVRMADALLDACDGHGSHGTHASTRVGAA
jgi:two-component system chemotaxis response regulator CheB